jgi:hypothetical protein
MATKTKKVKNPEYAEASRAALKAFSSFKAAQKKAADAKSSSKEADRKVQKLEADLEKARESADEALGKALGAVNDCNSAEYALKEAREALKEIPEWIVED